MTDDLNLSRIPRISSVIDENNSIGPTGPTGPTGPVGGYVTGPTGNIGKSVSLVQGISKDTVRIYFNTEPVSYIDITDVDGPTGNSVIGGFTVGFTGITQGAVFPVQMGTGVTLFFKTINLVGDIKAQYTGDDLVISELSSPFEGSFLPGSLLYIGLTLGSDSFYNLISATNTEYYEKYFSGFTYSGLDFLFYGFRENGSGSNLNYATSPTGITFYTNASVYGMTFDTSGFCLSNAIPYLKYGVSFQGASSTVGFTIGTILFEQKDVYNRVIGSTTYQPLNEKIGSCCYCNVNGDRFCTDYSNKTYCTYILGGNWSPTPCYQRYNTADCYPGGACCVNNRCLSCSKEKCLSMGGLFLVGENCSSIECPDRCSITLGCCCVNGQSYSLTEELCAEIQNSRFFDEPCSLVDCCKVGYLGACCIKKVCYDYFSAMECAATGGIFQGPGSECISQFLNCCTDPLTMPPAGTPAMLAAMSQTLPGNPDIDDFPQGPSIPFDDPRWNEPPFLPDGLPNPNWPGWSSDTWPVTEPTPPNYAPFFTAPGEKFEDPDGTYPGPISVPTQTPVERGIPPAYITPDGQELYWDGEHWWIRDPRDNDQPEWRFTPNEPRSPNNVERWVPYVPGYGVPVFVNPEGRWDRAWPQWFRAPAYTQPDNRERFIFPPTIIDPNGFEIPNFNPRWFDRLPGFVRGPLFN